MMSVGVFTYSSKPRGSVVHAACLCEALERAGASATLYALSKPGDEFYRSLTCSLRLIPAAAAPQAMDALIAQRIAEFQRGIGVLAPRHAIVHAEDCLAANALIGARGSLLGARVVRTVHHVEAFESPYLTACQARSVSDADLVLSVSEATRRAVKAEFSREAPVISNGVEHERFATPLPVAEAALRAKLGIAREDRVVLSVGGVEERKNSLRALEAVALAFAREPRVRWIIAGGASIWEHESYRARFQARLAELPAALRARVHVLGTVSEDELTAAYRVSQVLLCPSLQEGFGLCVLEAMSAGAAVIVPRGEPFSEYLDERTARFVNPESETEIAAALARLLGDESMRNALAQHGRERARQYSWDRVAERHLSRYENLLSGSARAEQQTQI